MGVATPVTKIYPYATRSRSKQRGQSPSPSKSSARHSMTLRARSAPRGSSKVSAKKAVEVRSMSVSRGVSRGLAVLRTKSPRSTRSHGTATRAVRKLSFGDSNNKGEGESAVNFDEQSPDKGEVETTNLERVKKSLHTSEVPEQMLSREEECEYIDNFIRSGIKQGRAKSQTLYISGVPGTGKTASVLKVVENLKNKPSNKFQFININGLELSDPKKLFCTVYKEVTKDLKRITPGNAQGKLNHMFTMDRRGRPLVLLIDELDTLVTNKQEVVYTVFNWTSYPGAKVSVIAISNTLDLPERTLSQRVASRLGSNRLCFQPYDHSQITAIIEHRIAGCPAVDKQAIQYAARKVASLSGDLRKAMELLRRAIDIALEQHDFEGDTGEPQLAFSHVNEAIKESTSSIRVEMCLGMSEHEECLFRAMVRDLRKSALEDTIFYRLLDEYKQVCFGNGMQPLSSSALFRMLMELARSGIFSLSADGGEMNRRVQLGFSLPEAEFCVRQFDHTKKKKDEKRSKD